MEQKLGRDRASGAQPGRDVETDTEIQRFVKHQHGMFLQVCHVIDTGTGKMVQLHPIGSSYPTFPDSIWSHDLSSLVSDPHNFYTCNVIKGADDDLSHCGCLKE